MIPIPAAPEACLPEGFTAGVASDAERDEALAQTHGLWGSGRTLAQYRHRTAELMATPWAREHFRFWVLRDPAGRVAASCKAYELPLWVLGRVWPALGIGAVFTPPERRGRGHAAAMLRCLLAERTRRGDCYATLFSDIGHAYYKRLGFAPLEVGKFATEPSRLPPSEPGLRWREAGDAELGELAELARGTIQRYYLAYDRGRLDLAHLSLAHRAPFRFLERNGEPRGFALVASEALELEILELGLRDPGDLALLLGALRELLPEGCRRVHGWLPAASREVQECFSPEAESDALWMIARLRDEAPATAQIPPHRQLAWSDDHF